MPVDYGVFVPLSQDLAEKAGLNEKPPVYEWKPRYRWYVLAVDAMAVIAVVVFVVKLCQK